MIDKNDLVLIAHSIAVANKHSSPNDWVKSVVDVCFADAPTTPYPEFIKGTQVHVIDEPEALPTP